MAQYEKSDRQVAEHTGVSAEHTGVGNAEHMTYLVARDIGLHPGITLKMATHIDRKDKEHATLLPEGLVELLLIVFLQTNSETQGELCNFHRQLSLTGVVLPTVSAALFACHEIAVMLW